MVKAASHGSGRRLVIEADGGSRGNPGVAGYGALVRDPSTGRVLVELAEPLGKASNNVVFTTPAHGVPATPASIAKTSNRMIRVELPNSSRISMLARRGCRAACTAARMKMAM